MKKKRIAVTGGGSGGGRAVVHELLAHDLDVVILDRAAPDSLAELRQVDLTVYADTVEALSGVDAVIHFAADPVPDHDLPSGATKFQNNALSTYNVFNASVAHSVQKVIWASSETVFGFPFEHVSPEYLPVDDGHPLLPQNSYAIAKVLCEQLARHLNRLYALPFLALRLSNILYLDPEHPASYAKVPSYWSNPRSRAFNLWGYIDARDVARSARLAIESDFDGADEITIAAEDTIMDRPSADLAAAVFPTARLRPGIGRFSSLLSPDKARQRIGFRPAYSWRDVVEPQTR